MSEDTSEPGKGKQSRNDDDTLDYKLSCPVPSSEYPQVLLAHGGGGRLTHDLITKIFVPTFDNTALAALHDGAVFQFGNCRLAVSTDSFVVSPLFFPGGDIGSLAVHGTVNNLAMCGARPMYLSAAYIMEEGLDMGILCRIVASMQRAAKESGVEIVTGDTKVVERGKGDGLYINTAGIGIVSYDRPIRPDRCQVGDVVVLSGDVGRHGMAVMAAREGLDFESAVVSDLASLSAPALALLEAGVTVRCFRDLTRGGLARALVEIAEGCGRQVDIDEVAVPVRGDVRAACERLGLDPISAANGGRFIAIVRKEDADRTLEVLGDYDVSSGAVVIGSVAAGNPDLVTARTAAGTRRVFDMISDEQLPRIC